MITMHNLMRVILLVFLLEPVLSSAKPAGELNEEGLDALAYSYALQAYLYTYPLFITDREVRRREQLEGPVKNAPIAPINRLGHLQALADADSNMPYSPNNDTLYTGIALDLTDGPIILHMPEIKDRFAVVQVTNAYVENQPYRYSPRVNDGDAASLAFTPPGWDGQLPEGVEQVPMDTNYAFMAVRIAIDGEHELDVVRGYQQQMSLTSLADWGKEDPAQPAIPAPREQKTYDGPFAHMKKAADLLAQNPPPARHQAINASLWRVGLRPGEAFDPDTLDDVTRRAVLRAIEDGPKVIDYLSRNRGKTFPNGWDAGRYADDIVFDYAARAAMALVGLMGNDPEEAIYLYTYFDSEGQLLDASKRYRMHFEPGQTPAIQELGFWSVTMYDGKTYRFVHNEIDRFSVGSRSGLKYNDDGSLDIYIQPEAPDAEHVSNWLPSAESGSFRVTFRIYGPAQETVDALYSISLAIPPLELQD